MFKKTQIDATTVTFRSLRLLLPLTIWSCHTCVAPTFRLYNGLAAAASRLPVSLKNRRTTAGVISQAKAHGQAPIPECATLLCNDPGAAIPGEAGIQLRNTVSMAQRKTPNSLL